MERTFIEIPSFSKRWCEIGLTDDDLRVLQQHLPVNPEMGDKIAGTGGLPKVRYALGDRGKSSGARVCYVDFASFENIYLIQVFTKDEKVNLSQAEKNNVKRMISILKEEAKGNWRENEQCL